MNDYEQRRLKVQQQMKASHIDGMIITQNVDLFYFTGSMQSGYGFFPVQGEPAFYVRRSISRAEEESAITVKPLGSFRAFGESLAADYPLIFTNGSSPTLAVEYDVLPVQLFHKLQSVVPKVNWVDGSAIIREIRMIKSSSEISAIKAAATIVDIALEQAISEVKVGMSELELISIIERTMRLHGHAGIMRMRGFNQEIITGMVGSGSAAAQPTYFDGPAGGQGLSAASPQSAGRKLIEYNEPILVDIGCCYDGYVIDQTRTLVVGELAADMISAYSLAEVILKETELLLKPGTICETLYSLALAMAEQAGLGDHFMGYAQDQVRFLGHGIGLEIDEFPILAQGFAIPLEPGMVIAIEPKFTFPDRGVVGIENTYLITIDGFEKLTTSREGIITIAP